MKSKISYFILGGFILVIMILSFGESEGDYLKSIEKIREERIVFLKNSEASPFRTFSVPFQEPEYFPIDKKYRLNATLKRLSGTEKRTIANSDGTADTYTSFALASFTLDGKDLELLILKQAGFGQLNVYFTGFADATSAESTYGGGRYLDLEIGKSDKVVIDFNLAYNPYCAYVAGYTCPLPPKQNLLPVAIEAGEKVGKEK